MLTVPRLPRSVSAYDNCATSFDEEFDDEVPSSARCDEKEEEEVQKPFEKEMLEISISRDSDQPHGMAFRMVGSRSRGIFIDYVHPESVQSEQLHQGDRLLRCHNISLQAVSVDQAASILRFWMNRNDSLDLLIERRSDGELMMLNRRRRARLSMCDNQQEIANNFTAGKVTLRLTSSKSAEVFRCQNEAWESSSFNSKTPQYESFHKSPTRSICPHCNSHTRMIYLHQFSHGLVNNAFRFLTVSRSNYSLL